MRSALPLAVVAAALLACGKSARTSSAPAAGFSITDAVTGLGPATDLGFLPDGRLVITEKTGAVRLAALGGAPALAGAFPVDTASEKGLLGVLVPSTFAADRRLVFYYSRSDAAGGSDLDRQRVVSVVLGGDDTLDLASEQVLVSGLRGPQNHDGGGMAIGPDGLLYVGAGDSGCNTGRPPEPPSAPGNYFATCLTNGNGKILRVALDGSIPADNPLMGVDQVTACQSACGAAPTGLAAPRTDLWAWGFRNPWRFAFDPVTGALWVGDVGEVSYEEVTVVQRGRHHGWPWREGRHGWAPGQCRTVVPDTGDCVDPVYECRHGDTAGGIDGGCEAITGGAFLTGSAWPEAQRSLYVFGDNQLGSIWSLQLTPDRMGVVPGSRQLIDTEPGPVSFRTGPDGALYVAVFGGKIVRIGPGG